MENFIPLLIILFLLFLLWKKKNKSPERKGADGESIVAAIATTSINKGLYGRVFRNIYVPRDDGSTSEIDVLLVCVKGIFVFESKNYAGYIFGNDQNKNWTVSLYAGKNWLGNKTTEKHSFYNPVWQNRTHIKALRSFIDTTAPYFSIIVFSDRGVLKDIAYDTGKVTILKSSQMKHFMRDIREMYPDVLSQEEVDSLSGKLAQYTGTDELVKIKHLESIKNRTENPNICPWCGGELVVRTAKNGPYEGNQFYGCSNYPNCRYIRNIR